MIYRIPYQIYEFNGKLINLKTYQELKLAFESNSYLEFPEPKTYYEEHTGESNIVLICLGICIILIPFKESIDGTFLMLVLALSFIGLLFSVIFQFSQFFSFQKARKKQMEFFKNLKQDILNSADYEQLVLMQRKRFKYVK